jgi:O-methyltransferase
MSNEQSSVQPAVDPVTRRFLVPRALESIYYPHAAERTFPTGNKEQLYDFAAQVIGDAPITYLEFGVHRGWSMSRIAGRFPCPNARFFGFDSFEGLPEGWTRHNTGHLNAGHFTTHGRSPAFQDGRITYVKGWFQNTVPHFLSSNKVGGPVLVHFDADLYSSTLFLLSTLWHSVPDYFFLFDEFLPDEVIALFDFARAYPVHLEFLAATETKNKRPAQVFGHSKKIEFKPKIPQ